MNTKIGDRIKKARKDKGSMKPAELAAAVGVGRSVVHAWEHGGPLPSLSILKLLGEKLGVDHAVLLDLWIQDKTGRAKKRRAA